MSDIVDEIKEKYAEAFNQNIEVTRQLSEAWVRENQLAKERDLFQKASVEMSIIFDKLREELKHRTKERDDLLVTNAGIAKLLDLDAIKLKVERDELAAKLKKSESLVMEWENREASVCPEDTSFEDTINQLTKECDRLRAELQNPPPDVQERVIQMLNLVSADAVVKVEKERNDLRTHLRAVCSLTIEDGAKKIVETIKAAEITLREGCDK